MCLFQRILINIFIICMSSQNSTEKLWNLLPRRKVILRTNEKKIPSNIHQTHLFFAGPNQFPNCFGTLVIFCNIGQKLPDKMPLRCNNVLIMSLCLPGCNNKKSATALRMLNWFKKNCIAHFSWCYQLIRFLNDFRSQLIIIGYELIILIILLTQYFI